MQATGLRHITLLTLWLAILVVIGACSHTPQPALDAMDRAESLMEQHPDSALAILETVNPKSLRSKADKARRSLLMTMAVDKNYIDTTDFRILQPALDYYISHGTPDQRLKTRYYEGVIWINQGNDSKALVAFLRAAEDSPACHDSLALARLYVGQGNMYYKEFDYENYTQCNLQAADIYHSVNDTIHYLSCLSRALNGAALTSDTITADRIFSECLNGVEKYSDQFTSLTTSVVLAYPTFKSHKEFMRLYDQLSSDSTSIYNMGIPFAYAFGEYGDYDKAYYHLTHANITDSVQFNAIRAELLENIGDYQKALEAYKKFFEHEENEIQEKFDNNLLFTRRDYEKENEKITALRKKDRVIYLIVIIVLILAGLCSVAFLRVKNLKLKKSLLESDLALISQELNGEKIALERVLKENNQLISDISNQEYIITEKTKESHELRTQLKNKNQLLIDKERESGRRNEEKEELARRLKYLIRNRLSIINEILAKEITSNNKSLKKYNQLVDKIKNDIEGFIRDLRNDFTIAYPLFMKHLKECGLTDIEISEACLYGLGLKGYEVGFYLNRKSYNNDSSSIRRKLGIDTRKGNMNHHIQYLMEILE
ncbi:MAG: hypothetical protein HDT05_04635 [Bacteroidales bacterium]|nr:hypothetical protein [Bacteroidales bacterium]